MSDLMLLGVLRAPTPEPDDVLGIAQLADRARQAADRIEELEAENGRLRTERDEQGKNACELFDEAKIRGKRVAELEAENERWKKQHERDVLYYSGLEKANADLSAKNEQLTAAIEEGLAHLKLLQPLEHLLTAQENDDE